MVRFGSRVVTTTNTDGFRFLTQAAPVPGYPGRLAHSVSVFFPYGRDGSTEVLTVAVGRPLASRSSVTLVQRFPIVRVNRVEAAYVTAPIGFSEAEVFNIFGRALYRQFNGSTNSAEITMDDGERVRIYGYDPGSMYVTVDSRGVSFGFRFKIDKPCQPRAHVQGRFKLNADFFGISLNWVVPPYANLQPTTGFCNLLQLTPLVGLVLDNLVGGAEGQIGAGVQGAIEEMLEALLPDAASIGAASWAMSRPRDWSAVSSPDATRSSQRSAKTRLTWRWRTPSRE
jgi:hypothetical protein